MIKILSAEQIREADYYTIQHEPISSINLMERAAKACYSWITEKHTSDKQVAIFCGPGNNGGDGLAVARMLLQADYKVQVYVINFSTSRTDDFKINYRELHTMAAFSLIEINDIGELKITDKNIIFIDVLFGSGLNKPVKGLAADVINYMNQSGNEIISIDLPSGLFCDSSSLIEKNTIVKAAHTLTFELPKLCFLFPENAAYFGKVHVLPIGLHKDYINSAVVKNYMVQKQDVAALLKPRKEFSHKGNYGHALLISGSYGKMGAAVLAARACLRSGVGLLTCNVPQSGYTIMQTAVPEAMVIIDESEKYIETAIYTDNYSAIGIGPGIGTGEATANALKQLIQNYRTPMVFDADAINILAENKTWLSFIPPQSIFTPHPKEFERLAGKSNNNFERQQSAIDFAAKYNCYVILKGRYTLIACPDSNSYFNTTGNAGMATGGSGDVLTGVITSLLAQGYTPKEACLIGVYVHGFAGDLAKKTVGETGLIAGDIVRRLPGAFNNLLTAAN